MLEELDIIHKFWRYKGLVYFVSGVVLTEYGPVVHLIKPQEALLLRRWKKNHTDIMDRGYYNRPRTVPTVVVLKYFIKHAKIDKMSTVIFGD